MVIYYNKNVRNINKNNSFSFNNLEELVVIIEDIRSHMIPLSARNNNNTRSVRQSVSQTDSIFDSASFIELVIIIVAETFLFVQYIYYIYLFCIVLLFWHLPSPV